MSYKRFIKDLNLDQILKYSTHRQYQQQLIPNQPILMLHGLFGFKHLLGRYIYYHDIFERLRMMGAKVVAPIAHPTDSIANRAKDIHVEIQKTLKQYNTDKVHIIAHSMGGLDARYLCSKLDYKNSVLSLTTLSTPHRGSYIADWATLNIIQKLRIEKLMKSIGIPFEAIDNLSPQFLNEQFNPMIKDVDNIVYQSYGAMKSFSSPISSPFYLFGKLLEEKEGPNDGLVSVKSAEWGSDYKVLNECDHLNLINWTKGFDVNPVYSDILKNLVLIEMFNTSKTQTSPILISSPELSNQPTPNDQQNLIF